MKEKYMARKTITLTPVTVKILEKMGRRIKRARLRRNIKAEVLAERAGISIGTLNSIEKFRNHNPLNYVIKISKNNYGIDETNKIVTIPLYEVFLLLNELKNDN